MIDSAAYPPYEQIVGLLLKPFLAEPAALRVDCEYLPTHARVWVRIAFAETDREKVIGGSNRHLYAIKTILTAAARQAGQTVYLDVHGGVGGEPRAARTDRGASSALPSRAAAESPPDKPQRSSLPPPKPRR
jgi:uncharacterized protein